MSLVAAPTALPKPGIWSPTVAPAASTPYVTDYGSLLAKDSQLGSQNAAINAQGITDQAQLTAAQQRAFVNYGAIPTGVNSSLAGDITGATDATTAGLASAATAGGVSTLAQLQKAYANQTGADNASLAARGLIRSGAYGQHANEDLSNYNQAGYNAQQQLTDYLNGLYSGYQTQQQALRAQSQQAANDALQRIIAQINANPAPATPTGGGTTPVDTTWAPPEYGPDAGYTPNGVIPQTGALNGQIVAQTYTVPGTSLVSPGGGVYTTGGGAGVAYQSKKGTYGGKPLY